MAAQQDMAWVGIDVGKIHHWACVVNADGKTLLSVKITNDETEIVALLANAGALATQLLWAVDIIGAPRRCCSHWWPERASRCGMRRAG